MGKPAAFMQLRALRIWQCHNGHGRMKPAGGQMCKERPIERLRKAATLSLGRQVHTHLCGAFIGRAGTIGAGIGKAQNSCVRLRHKIAMAGKVARDPRGHGLDAGRNGFKGNRGFLHERRINRLNIGGILSLGRSNRDIRI